jgi:hypothetical protein
VIYQGQNFGERPRWDFYIEKQRRNFACVEFVESVEEKKVFFLHNCEEISLIGGRDFIQVLMQRGLDHEGL